MIAKNYKTNKIYLNVEEKKLAILFGSWAGIVLEGLLLMGPDNAYWSLWCQVGRVASVDDVGSTTRIMAAKTRAISSTLRATHGSPMLVYRNTPLGSTMHVAKQEGVNLSKK